MVGTADYFRGRTLLLTGAASGIGRATALVFAREGANVVCADVDADGARRTAADVDEQGGNGLALDCDVTRRSDVEAAVSAGIERFGGIDFQFNNAGSAIRASSFLDIDDELFDATFDLNVKGVLYGMQAVLGHMLERGGGVIVNTASMAWVRGGPGRSVHYASAKAAVVTMSMGVAREFAADNIRCIPIAPAAADTKFQTDFHNRTREEARQGAANAIPIGRIAEPEEIAELVLFLCSDACPYLTADPIKISGGGGYR
jgi:NAD(P)-dependent dehydrogenase (short-subunit alcohol dehydrogenase family)